MHKYLQFFPTRVNNDHLDVVSLLRQGLTASPEKIHFCIGGEAWTRRRLRRRVAEVSAWLSRMGVQRGDRVGVMLKNSADHVALVYALILLGAVWVPVNTRLKSAGLLYLLDHCHPVAIITDPEFDVLLQDVVDLASHGCRVLHTPGDQEHAFELPDEPVVPGDTLCLIYTSGTTGAPKAVQFTHRMMRIAGEAALLVADAQAGDRLLVWEPLYHIGGAQMLMLPFMADVQLQLVPGFSASRFWEQVCVLGSTQLHYLGGVLEILLTQTPNNKERDHQVRVAWGAGLGVQAWASVSNRFGVQVRECYGMTECSSFATVNSTGKVGSIGRPLPWISLQLIDADGNQAREGQIGEIVLSSPVDGVFTPGYLNHAEATAAALRGGSLHTGDLARADAEGNLFFVGRKTDSMRVKGENVSAWEVERGFSSHPSVKLSAAVGVKSDIGEQDILLYVQFREGVEADFAALAQWAKNQLPSFQRPRYYVAVESFELTPSERIRKHLLPRETDNAWDAVRELVPGVI